MDNFHEESISKINSGLNNIFYILAYIGVIIFGFMSLLHLTFMINGNFNIFSIIYVLLFGGVAYGCLIIRNNQRIEYDYTFTNGILDIAKVINRSSRKPLLSTNIKDFEIVAPTSDEEFQRMLNNKGIEKRYNYFLNRGGGLYYGVFMHEGKKALLVFEPSDTLIKLFKIYNPRNIKAR